VPQRALHGASAAQRQQDDRFCMGGMLREAMTFEGVLLVVAGGGVAKVVR